MLQRTTTGLRPLTTAHLAQTMTLLSLTTEELQQEIDSELASNPRAGNRGGKALSDLSSITVRPWKMSILQFTHQHGFG